jgi:hypothetical protein
MSSADDFRRAWAMTLAPVLFFLPAFWLAGMGPCTFSHPAVMLIASLIFIGLEVAALRVFVRAFRFSFTVIAGSGLAGLLLTASVYVGWMIVVEFM